MKSIHAVALFTLLVACKPSGPATNTIKIGAVLSISEDCSAGVDEIVEALALGTKEINAAGGVLGKKIELLIRDDASSADVAKTVFTGLADKEKPAAVIGAICSSVTRELIPLAQQRKIVLVSPSSTSPTLSQLGAGGYFYRACASDSEQGKLLAQRSRSSDILAGTPPNARVAAVIHDRTAYGEGLKDAFKAAFEGAGGGAVAAYGMATTEDANASEAEFATNAAFNASVRPDVVLLATFPTQADLVLRRYQAQFVGDPVVWLFPDALRVDSFADALKSSGSTSFNANRNNHLGTGPGTPKTETYTAFAARFNKEYGKNPNAGNYSPHAYDALYAIALAMQAAGIESGEAINAEMVNISTGAGDANAEKFGPERFGAALAAINSGKPINFQGATTPIDFNANGDTRGTFDIWHAIEGAFVTEENERDILPE